MNQIEKEIVLKILEDASRAGYAITVYDGGETVIEKSENKEAVFAEMYSTDEDTLIFDQGDRQIGWVFLVYGNDYAVISDYSDNSSTEELLKNAMEIAEKYS